LISVSLAHITFNNYVKQRFLPNITKQTSQNGFY